MTTLAAALLAALAGTTALAAPQSAYYRLQASALSAGATRAGSAAYSLHGTVAASSLSAALSSGRYRFAPLAASLFETHDFDGDLIADTADNCLSAPNTDQLDTDADLLGNACDEDDDADGVPDARDPYPLDAARGPAADDDCLMLVVPDADGQLVVLCI